MGHLNGILARVGGNLNNNFQKSQMPGGLPGGGGMLKLRFDRYIRSLLVYKLKPHKPYARLQVTEKKNTKKTIIVQAYHSRCCF